MKMRIGFLLSALCLAAGMAMAQDTQLRQGEQGPPPQAYEDCKGKKAGDTVQHTTPQGEVAAVCEDSPKGLVARPKQPMGPRSDERPSQGPPMTEQRPRENARKYSLEQALSDEAQLHTTALTGDAGGRFLDVLNAAQYSRLTEMLDRQRKALREIVESRHSIATRPRGLLRGEAPSETEIMALGRRYGELDGEPVREYATASCSISKSLAPKQKEQIQALRSLKGREEGTAFLYSDRIPIPRLPDAAFLFGSKTTQMPANETDRKGRAG